MSVYGDMGSSLMSARGYDSDAQYIGTPRHLEPLNTSPNSPAFRGMELNDLIEGSRERNASELWTDNRVQTHPNGPGPPFGMHFIPTPPGSMRGQPRGAHAKPSMEGTSSQSVPSLGNGGSGHRDAFTKSLPSLHPSQEIASSQEHLRARDGVVGGSGENLQSLVADWAQYLGGSPQGYRTASSGSVHNQPQEILVSKRRQQPGSQRTVHEFRAPRLGDMGISQRVAGTDMGSGQTSINPSMSDLAHPKRYGSLMASQENVLSSVKSGASTIVGVEAHKQAMLHKRDVSSFYSRQSSNPSGEASPVTQSLRACAENSRGNMPIIHQDMRDKAHVIDNQQYLRTELRMGRFVEQFGDSNLTLVQDQDMSSEMAGQRKVSPGWMTGGRRMGYGYTMVDNAEREPTHIDGIDSPLPNGGWRKQTPEPTPSNVQTREMNGSLQHQTDMAQSTHSGSPEQSPICHSPDNRRLSNPKNPTKALGGPISTPDLWARMKSRSVRASRHAPLAVDLAADQMAARSSHSPIAVREQQKAPTLSKGVDYVEDTESFLGRWTKNSLFKDMQPQPLKANKVNGFQSEERQPFQEGSPSVQRRFSMDQTNRPQSVYFDSGNTGSADQVEETPTRSQSGRWILRFSRNRESQRRSNLHPKEPSQDSSVQYQDREHQGLGRTNSTRSEMAEELASAYQECIEMPGAFRGSKWASRTSLVVEAE
ncbi:uncharacterized protein N7446_000607 [Penicillium canescens]|uniref:Uncharacterized protein n=1 Tax=Penicillium canescens TaxID=5083 RepID=A0AAD6I516_PENCN|nr:uncharacterized protein N7446_000607 [Penicillium canescens]KAJ6030332.1 hypothetical protein N7460_010598 [Penicillium canescens]KAJ6060704.1 hypothetical protein N7444_002558 [Penicillium canescens]KAJ6077671.1 hypothetical protein N7446_000607 [Penicillium canescens]